ncbi:MAG TPA: hypothetical protein VJQ47_06910 [Steroidobacteraceae bacterium]|nr:hypothetical protein [Steroidobacteraceae bacterium]
MSVTLNAGSGGATCGTDTVAGTPNIDYQIVKLGYSVSGTTPTQVSASNPLPANVAQLGGNAIKTGSGNGSSGSLSVYLATDQPTLTNAQPVAQSGSWTVTANLGTLNGVALDASVTGLQVAQGSTTAGQKGGLTLGAVTTAAPTYTTAQSSPLSLTTAGALRVDGSAITQPVSGTFWQATQPISAASLPLPSGAATAAKQPALGTAGAASTDVITVQGIASMTALKVDGSAVTQPVSGTVTANAGTGTYNIQANASVNLNQVGGSAITLGSKTSANSLPVVIASDQGAVPALQSGSWTVSISGTPTTTANQGTANTAANAWPVTLVPQTGNGWSKFSTPKNNSNTALTNTVVSVKASAAGEMGGYIVYNPNASVAYIQVFDVATAGGVTLGTTRPDMVIPVPPTSGANLEFANGVSFANGIQIAATTTDSGSTALGTGLTVTMVYK